MKRWACLALALQSSALAPGPPAYAAAVAAMAGRGVEINAVAPLGDAAGGDANLEAPFSALLSPSVDLISPAVDLIAPVLPGSPVLPAPTPSHPIPEAQSLVPERRPAPEQEAAALPELEAVRTEAAPALEAIASDESSPGEDYGAGQKLADALAGVRNRGAASLVQMPPGSGRGLSLQASRTQTDPIAGSAVPAVLGLAALSLSAWPAVALVAGLAALVAGFLAYDVASGGRFSQGFMGGRAQGRLAREIPPRLDLRETERPLLQAFLSRWSASTPEGRRELLELAAADPLLWREKLAGAALLERDPALIETLNARLQALSRTRMEPLEPVLEKLPGREEDSPRPGSLGRSVAAWTLGLTAAGLLALAGWAGHKTAEFGEVRAQGSERALRVFYGEEDYPIFSYRDRDLQEPLKVLRRWNERGPGAERAFQETVASLRRNPNPRADILLDLLFKHAPRLPLGEGAQEELLTALIDRGRPQVWTFVSDYAEGRLPDPGSRALLLRILSLAPRGADQRAFGSIFSLLDNKDQEVRRAAEEAVDSWLARPERDDVFLAALEGVSSRYEHDPQTQLRVERHLFRRLARSNGRALDLVEVNRVLFHTASVMMDADRRRPAPGDPLFLALSLRAMKDPAGALDDLSGIAVRVRINQVASVLIQEGAEAFPGSGLKEGMSEEERDSGFYLMRRLPHLRRLSGALGALGPGQDARQGEFLDRSARLLPALLDLGKAASLGEGDSPEERAADALNPELSRVGRGLEPREFQRALAEAGLAPDVRRWTAFYDEYAYRGRYGAKDLARVYRVVSGLLDRGKLPGSPDTALDWARLKSVAGLLGKVEAVSREEFPGAPVAFASATPFRLVTALKAAAAAGNAREARLALGAAFDRAPAPVAFLAGVAAQAQPGSSGDDPGLQLEIIRFLTERLPRGRLDGRGAQDMLRYAFESLRTVEQHRSAWAMLRPALEKVPRESRLRRQLGWLVSWEIHDTVRFLVREANASVFTGEDRARFAAGLPDSGLVRPGEKVEAVRRDIQLVHLRELRGLLAGLGRDSPGKGSFLREADETLRLMHEAGLQAGIRDGGSVGERVADTLNETLEQGNYHLHPPEAYLGALEAAGLVPKWDGASPRSGNPEFTFKGSYERKDLDALARFFTRLLREGRWRGGAGKETPLSESQRDYLARTLETVDALRRRHYPKDADRLGTGEADSLGGRMLALNDPDPKVKDWAQKALLELSASYAGKEDAFVAMLGAAQSRHAADTRLQRWILAFLAERLGPEAPGPLQERAFKKVWDAAMRALRSDSGEGPWAVLERAAASAPKGSSREVLSALIRAEIAEETRSLILESEQAFPGFKGKLLASRVRTERFTFRFVFRLSDLRNLRAAILEASAAGRPDDARKARSALRRAEEVLPRLIRLGERVGMPAGDTPGELLAEKANEILYRGAIFHGPLRLLDTLRRAGLAPPERKDLITGIAYSSPQTLLAQSYSPDGLRSVIAVLRRLLDRGGWESRDADYLRQALRELERLLPEEKGHAEPLPGFALLGLLPLSLSAWPTVLVLALASAAVAGFLAYDLATGGRFSRWIMGRWRGRADRALAREIPPRLGLREADRLGLEEFLSGWTQSESAAKPALIESAASDPGLWREKLAGAARLERDPGLIEALRARLQALSRSRMEPLEPVLERLPGREKPAATRNSGRVAAWALGFAAAALLALAGAAGFKTAELEKSRAQAEQAATDVFYGDDAFLFRIETRDERLKEALRAMRRWKDAGPGAERDFEAAIRGLRGSSDPSSDLALDAIFKRADRLPLTQAGADELLQALMERDRELVWQVFSRAAAHPEDPASAALLGRLIDVAGRADTDKAFEKVFALLRVPDADLRAKAEKAVALSLGRRENEEAFLRRLDVVGRRYAADVDLQLWVERLLLRRLGRPGAEGFSFVRMQPMFARVLAASGSGPAAKVLEQEVAASPRITDPMAYAARFLIDAMASGQIRSDAGTDSFLGRVRNFGRWLVGAEDPRPAVQRTYLVSDLLALVGEAQGDRADLYRSLARTAAKIKVPESGDEPEVRAAAEVNEALFNAVLGFRSRFGLWGELRKAGFALNVNSLLDKDRALRWRYDAAARERLARFFEDFAVQGWAWDYTGMPLPMTWQEKRLLAEAAAKARGDGSLPTVISDLEKAYARERAKDFFLARLQASLSRSADPALHRWAIAFTAARLAAGEVDQSGAFEVLSLSFGRLQEAGRSEEAWSALLGALKDRRGPPGSLRRLVQDRINREAPGVLEEARFVLYDPTRSSFHGRLEKSGLTKGGKLRPALRLEHLRALKEAIASAMEDAEARAPSLADIYRGRSAKASRRLDLMLEAGALAGVAERISPAELAAEDLHPALEETLFHFVPGMDLPQALLAAGLARRVPVEPSERDEWDLSGVFLDAYSAAQLDKLQEVLEQMQSRGTVLDRLGKSVPLATGQRAALMRLSDRVSEVRARHFPQTRPARSSLGSLMGALKASDAKARAAAQSAFIARLTEPGGEGALLARLQAARAAHPKDAELELWSLDFLSRRLGGPQGPQLKAAGVEFQWRELTYQLRILGKDDEAWAALEKALDDLAPGQGAALKAQVLSEVRDRVMNIAAWARLAFYQVEMGKKIDALKLPQPKNAAPLYRQVDLDALQSLIQAEVRKWKESRPLDKDQREVEQWAETIPRLKRIGQKAGMP